MKRLHPYDHSTVADATVSTSGNRFVEEISAYAAKEKQKQSRRNAAPESLGPTPERLAKAGAVEEILVPIKDEGTRATQRVTRMQSIVDRYSNRLTEEDRAALARAAKDYFDSLVPGTKVIGGYGQSAGGSAYGPRSGGVSDRAREAFSRTAHLSSHLGPEAFEIFKALVEMLDNMKLGLSPWGDNATTKGVNYGAMLMLSKIIKAYYYRERALNGRQGLTRTEQTARDQAGREARARRAR